MTAWSAWQPLPVSPPFTATSLTETLDGGQAFRWNRQADGAWFGIWGDCVAHLRIAAGGTLEWSAPTVVAERVAAVLPRYLALDVDYTALVEALPWRSDPPLAACLNAWRGLRLLPAVRRDAALFPVQRDKADRSDQANGGAAGGEIRCTHL